MRLSFFGAAHEVTGSCHLLEACGKNILIDCGMEQGPDLYENQELPVAPGDVDYILLTHAHIDHSGNIPLLVKKGFSGEIITTFATADLCDIMLRDSAHIQEFEAEWRNRKARRRLVSHDLQVLLDQAILHPVLADLTGLAVGDQLVGIQSDLEVQVVVDHDLEGLSLGAVALVLLDGLAVQLALGTEAVAIDTAMLLQLLSELLGHLLVMVGMDVTQSVLDGQSLVGLGQVGLTAGSTTILRIHLGILRQVVVQLNGHGFVGCHYSSFFLLNL